MEKLVVRDYIRLDIIMVVFYYYLEKKNNKILKVHVNNFSQFEVRASLFLALLSNSAGDEY